MKPQDRFDWERSAIRYTDMPSTEKLVAYALGTFANADGTSARPGSALLATATGLHRSTVEQALSRLRDRGLIHQVSRGGGRKASEYELALPDALSVVLGDTYNETANTYVSSTATAPVVLTYPHRVSHDDTTKSVPPHNHPRYTSLPLTEPEVEVAPGAQIKTESKLSEAWRAVGRCASCGQPFDGRRLDGDLQRAKANRGELLCDRCETDQHQVIPRASLAPTGTSGW